MFQFFKLLMFILDPVFVHLLLFNSKLVISVGMTHTAKYFPKSTMILKRCIQYEEMP